MCTYVKNGLLFPLPYLIVVTEGAKGLLSLLKTWFVSTSSITWSVCLSVWCTRAALTWTVLSVATLLLLPPLSYHSCFQRQQALLLFSDLYPFSKDSLRRLDIYVMYLWTVRRAVTIDQSVVIVSVGVVCWCFPVPTLCPRITSYTSDDN